MEERGVALLFGFLSSPAFSFGESFAVNIFRRGQGEQKNNVFNNFI